jgi:hypothetical protein
VEFANKAILENKRKIASICAMNDVLYDGCKTYMGADTNKNKYAMANNMRFGIY